MQDDLGLRIKNEPDETNGEPAFKLDAAQRFHITK
jgi:hypothetical protein